MASFYNTTNSTNITTPDAEHQISRADIYRLQQITLGISIVIAICILIANVLLLLTIFTTPTLRRELRYLLIISMSFGDMLLGLFCVPLYIDFMLQSKITVSCIIHVVVQVLGQYAHVMITNVALFIINIDYIIKQYNNRPPQLTPTARSILHIFLASVPWIVMFIVVWPLIQFGLHQQIDQLWTEDHCPVIIDVWARTSLAVLCYYLPLIAALITSGVIIYGWVARNRGTVAFRPTLLNEEATPLVHPKFLIIVNIVCFLLLLPEHLFKSDIKIKDVWLLMLCYVTSYFFSMSKGVVLPIVWLAIPEVRQAFKEKCQLSYWRKPSDVPQHVINKSYREFVKEDDTD